MKNDGAAVLREISLDHLEHRRNAPHTVDRENLATRFCASLKDAAEDMLLDIQRFVEARTVEAHFADIACLGQATLP
ncbi:hypothetical protein GCM10007937_42920 [Mesorhizobium albiziae]|nr:hypothetical protein GCM10007937_42920 [Mesorhizobium albiziae]